MEKTRTRILDARKTGGIETRKTEKMKIVSALVLTLTLATAGHAFGWKNASPKKERERLPYNPQWVSAVKKGGLLKYKRKEFSSPSISGDRIFVGSDGGFFYAMKKENGRKEWRFKADAPVNSMPAAAGSRVFFGDDEGRLYAVSVDDGKLIWKAELGSEILSAPAVSADRVFGATVEGKLVSLNADDGRVAWEKDYHPAFTGNIKLTIRGNSAPILDERSDRLYVGYADGTMRCFSASAGKLLWERSLFKKDKGFSDIDGAAVIDGERVYVSSFDGGTFALDKKTGNTLWNQPNGSGVAPLSDGEDLYVSGSDGKLYALHKKDGSKRWEKKIGKGALTAPVVFKDVLAVGLSDDTMNFVDKSDGHLIARRFAKKGISSDPIVDGDRIYYLSNGGRLYSLQFTR